MYNVVGGHLFWSVCDEAEYNVKGMPSQDQMAHNDSTLMMYRYGVDMGQHVTIPLFFLMSGYVSSLAWRGGDGGILNFMKKRFSRLMLPYFFGLMFSVYPRGKKCARAGAGWLLLALIPECSWPWYWSVQS